MSSYALRSLVLKPTLACLADCPTCASRKSLHHGLKSVPPLSLHQWQELITQAHGLGARYLGISGGEPTLYKRLFDLIRHAKGFGWHVVLKTNGGVIDDAYADQLLRAGLDAVQISLYASTAELHDEMRRASGIWQRATGAIRSFVRKQSEYPDFRVNSQTTLTRANYQDFPALLALNRELGVQELLVSYLEGDYQGEHRLTQDQIEEFRQEIIPRAEQACESLKPAERLRALRTIAGLYSPDVISTADWAAGRYQPAGDYACKRPQYYAMILANGDVHPCNIVEYTHDPIMGNVRDTSFTELWHSEQWNDFRERRFDMCAYCPIPLPVSIPLRERRPPRNIEGMDLLGREVEVTIDRPLGSAHPDHGFVYELNYGYVPGTTAGDGEEMDAYVIGVDQPLKAARGRVAALVVREDDDENKLVVHIGDTACTRAEIEKLTSFQERFFETTVHLAPSADQPSCSSTSPSGADHV